jgi:ribose 5-phosphate isomerase B
MKKINNFIKNKTKIIIGSDHGGYILKEYIKKNIDDNYIIEDVGIYNTSKCDYPDIAKSLCNELLVKDEDCNKVGILICGTGIGMNITANKFKGIRCALCTNSHMAKMARIHNNANVLALGERITGQSLALDIVKTFLEEIYYKEERHERRINKIEN